jgi:hypothetical protein
MAIYFIKSLSKRINMVILIVAAIILMSAPNEPVPAMIDFTFMDQEGNNYRSTKLLEYVGAHNETDKQPMLLLIETPDINNPDFKKQYDEIRRLALTDANIITVVSCPVKEYDSNFHTDITTAASIRNNSKSFRVMLLDSNGNVKKHWFKSAKAKDLEKLFSNEVNINTGTAHEDNMAKETYASDSPFIQNPYTDH